MTCRFAAKLERVEGQDPPSPREPHPPPYPPPTYNEVNSQGTFDRNNNPQKAPTTPNQSRPTGSGMNPNGTSWYGNQGTYRTTKASEMRLQRGQMPNAGIRTSPRLSQESGSPREDSFEDRQSSGFEM